MADAGRPAVFLDRDGTILADPGFLREPTQVRLLPGAAGAVRRLNDAGFLVVLVTNQSGIARGKLTIADYSAVQGRLSDLLSTQGARFDAAYYCPHHPDFTGPCECRKPGTLLFRQAAAARGIDFPSSFFIGDRLSDVEPARTLGGRGILVETGEGATHAAAARELGLTVVADLGAAVDVVLGNR
jgi:D,D-heptose 1,7-bisphosphate phosphatase